MIDIAQRPRLRALIIHAFVQDDCVHCATVKAELARFQKAHPEVLVNFIDVTHDQHMRRHVQGFTAKGVPTILFSVGGEIQNKLTATTPIKAKEIERRWNVAAEG